MTDLTLVALGWTSHFARQGGPAAHEPLRIAEIHRNSVTAIGPAGAVTLCALQGTGALAVGDWVRAENGAVTHVFDRQTCLSRRAAGTGARTQLIAANVSTLGIVTSCNSDFNERRLERYLVLAADAGCLPLIVLTKADRSEEPDAYLRRAQRLSPLATALALDATDPFEITRLHPWCRAGDTLALVGSSGVGKTTLRNGLTGDSATTRTIREDDARGRHTTTARQMVRTLAGGWLIDTPGMRALRLADAAEGIGTVFADLETLALDCRFSDCRHESEPGCAVQAAIAESALDPDRLRRWRKLRAEEARNTETIAQARARDKGFGKMARGVKARKRMERGD